MVELLGKQELEKKRLEDGKAYMIQLPGYRYWGARGRRTGVPSG
jgi:hypothetical protein